MPAISLAAAALAATIALSTPEAASSEPVRNVVLVHGAVMDGSGWRGVYDRLTQRGMRVSIVQLPLTSLDADVAATRAVLDRQPGPVVLVGHSYGGAVISVAGDHARVRALVYVAAHQPDQGESVADLNARFPMPGHPLMVSETSMIVDPDDFRSDVAADLSATEADYLASAQRPTAVAVFSTKLPAAAWRTTPSWAIIARQDRTISPDLGRFMSRRSQATTIEIDASHAVYISRPAEVADVIVEASALSEPR